MGPKLEPIHSSARNGRQRVWQKAFTAETVNLDLIFTLDSLDWARSTPCGPNSFPNTDAWTWCGRLSLQNAIQPSPPPSGSIFFGGPKSASTDQTASTQHFHSRTCKERRRIYTRHFPKWITSLPVTLLLLLYDEYKYTSLLPATTYSHCVCSVMKKLIDAIGRWERVGESQSTATHMQTVIENEIVRPNLEVNSMRKGKKSNARIRQVTYFEVINCVCTNTGKVSFLIYRSISTIPTTVRNHVIIKRPISDCVQRGCWCVGY